ncbi:MAG: 2Fe-2S iron-sulfur cluster-binding protein [Paraclostridium sp.]
MTENKIVIMHSTEEITILKAAKEQNIKIKSLCKRGICGLCKVKVLEGSVSKIEDKEAKKLGSENVSNGYRLACKTTFSGTVKIEL